MPRIVVYRAPTNRRSKIVCEALFQGIHGCGEDVQLRSSLTYRGRPDADIAVFYGLADGLRRIFADYRAKRRAIYIDLGYWGRRKRTRYDGFHKMILNSRHPNAYFQQRRHPNDRFAQFGLKIRPWRDSGPNDPIVLAGMSAKAAATEGYSPEQWERDMARRLQRLTRRPIIYRPKPNWPGARPIPGTTFDPHSGLDAILARAHAVVCRHSNVAIDALLAGVPVFCDDGAALPLSTHSQYLHLIETPAKPDGRERWAADLAYCQFSIAEMESGKAWRILRSEGLV